VVFQLEVDRSLGGRKVDLDNLLGGWDLVDLGDVLETITTVSSGRWEC
jgi:hypothetical protein